MDRTSFLARSPKIDTVELPDGEKVKIRKLSQAEVEEAQRLSKTGSELSASRYVVRCALLNEDLTPMLTEADDAALGGADFDKINPVAVAVSKFSGLTTPKNG